MTDEAPTYESPVKRQLEQALAKLGTHASPEVRKSLEDALARLDHTDPIKVRELLPKNTLTFYQHTLIRGMSLVPLIKHSHDSGCFIESIILDHGLIQFALRGLYVLAWQRAVMPTSLTTDQLAPFYKQRSRQGDVYPLIDALERNKLLVGEHHANHLRMANDTRNKAAHGVIFGELAAADLAESSRKCQWAALGALEMLKNWFNNPRPLAVLPR
jgi:hypothetical protein